MTPSRRKLLSGMGGAVALASSPMRVWSQTPAAELDLASRMAQYADGLDFTQLSSSVVETTKIHIVDSLGCAVAALDEQTVRICRDVALASNAGGLATVIGSGRKTSADLAAFANGAALRYYDLNDVYVGRQAGHPSDNIAPCLAVAESEGATGAELITAIVLSYEICCRFLDAVNLGPLGWDHPMFSLPAVALASGKLMHLPPAKLAQAVGLAINDHIVMRQTRVQTLSDWKGISDAEAARHAIFAAMLARGGLTGPAPIFEGQSGLFKLVTGPLPIDVADFGGGGRPFLIEKASMKPFPAQVYTLTAIAAAQAIHAEIDQFATISSVEIDTTRGGIETSGRGAEKWAPTSKETADHSLPYVTARTLLDGKITNASYAADKLRDPAVLALMARTKVTEAADLTARQPDLLPNRISVTLANGRILTRQVDSVPGSLGRPMQRADAEHKFRDNVAGRWDEARIDAVLSAVWRLERENSLLALGRLLGPA